MQHSCLDINKSKNIAAGYWTAANNKMIKATINDTRLHYSVDRKSEAQIKKVDEALKPLGLQVFVGQFPKRAERVYIRIAPIRTDKAAQKKTK